MINRLPLQNGPGKFSPAGMPQRRPLIFQPAGIGRYPDSPETLSDPPEAIINVFSAGGFSIANADASNTGRQILSGALTATEYLSVLTVTGPGVLQVLTVTTVDASARQVGCRVTIDDIVVFEAISDAISAAQKGMVVVGSWVAAQCVAPQAVPFSRSLEIELYSSLTETDKVEARAVYWN